MKQYIIDIIESDRLAVLFFGKEDALTFDTIIDKRDNDSDLIELGKTTYETSYLVNLNHVRFVKPKDKSKGFNGF
ncbi:TPA: hypothetical protein TVE77_001665 [Streptococcus equi subsp. zooepidemicus]|uniref:hypothetical protein n=1 Tax=Streptococcus equi TaxID=1336 RepID=UPI00065A4F85|nr:hypothetical protein [Streptococcus equi]MBT1194113.1 hypothetical protein [Streptococcus equi subsp. equi]MCD3386882.1 hypothetical protein [Streptococcus equi subsp. zooepidemicus]MCD3390862.1 hypothetical protein [Streptococcus equi subsp. zooepidemicus]MCD3435593.1 hypothetical protein [Streptococcus equi subsp. zooepidemicus]MCD3438931.1 hypothetical protein [Streptococcus equi subsp. zooepidemicus]